MKLRKMIYVERALDGRKIKRKTAKSYGVFMDFNGIMRRLPLLEDRNAADTLAKNIHRLNDLRAANESGWPLELQEAVDAMPAGILAKLAKWDIVPSEMAASTKSLMAHVDDWRAALLAKGGTLQYADLSANRVKRIVAGCEFATVGDVSASKVQRFIAERRQDRKDDKGNTRRGIGAASFNYYLGDARGFFRWMVRDAGALANPLEHLQGVNTRTDKRHERRALAVDELHWLLDTTAAGPDRYGMSGAGDALPAGR